MDFSEREITDLAAFFAKRFPSYEQRAALSEAAGLAGEAQLTGDARSVWTDVIRVAVRDGRLNELVERAMQQRPDDDNLREMAAVIGAGKRWRARRWGALAAVGVVGLLGALVILQLGGDETELPTDTHGDGLAMVDVEQEPVAEAEPGPVAEPEPEPVAEPEPEPVAEPEPEAREDDARQPLSSKPRDDADHQGDSPPRPAREPQAAPSTVPDARGATGPAPKPTPMPKPPAGAAPLRCEGPAGEVIGYWYAGETSPGSAGASYTVDGGINVRADYPDVHNDFDARADLVCTLGHGWRLKLGRDPIAVPGGAYWVPLAPDDIVSR